VSLSITEYLKYSKVAGFTSVVYLAMNETIRREVKKLLFGRFQGQKWLSSVGINVDSSILTGQ